MGKQGSWWYKRGKLSSTVKERQQMLSKINGSCAQQRTRMFQVLIDI